MIDVNLLAVTQLDAVAADAVGRYLRGAGLPRLEIYICAAIAAPAGTPDTVISRLDTEFLKILESAELEDKWRTMDSKTLPSTPQEFTRFAHVDSKRWAEAVKISGCKASE